jgi:hypothetical protein
VEIYNALGKDPEYVPKVDKRERGMRTVLRRYGLGKRIGFARTAMRFMRNRVRRGKVDGHKAPGGGPW